MQVGFVFFLRRLTSGKGFGNTYGCRKIVVVASVLVSGVMLKVFYRRIFFKS